MLITKAELAELSKWHEANQAPEKIKAIIAKFIKLNELVADIAASNRSLLRRLREMMGFSPKSEKGNQLNQPRGA